MSTRHARMRAEKPPELRERQLDTTAIVDTPETMGAARTFHPRPVLGNDFGNSM
jgi:hypothetical protein